MSHPSSPTTVIFDANTLMGALAASNPDLPDAILHAILRSMIGAGQVEVANITSEDFPLKSRIRVPVSGLPVARSLAVETPATQTAKAPIGQIGQLAGEHEMLGPKAAASSIGVSRSTLDNWRRAGLIIALPKGRTGHLIPLVQFVHSRPLQGLDAVLSACSGDAARAWTALTAPRFDGQLCAIDTAAAGCDNALFALAKRLA